MSHLYPLLGLLFLLPDDELLLDPELLLEHVLLLLLLELAELALADPHVLPDHVELLLPPVVLPQDTEPREQRVESREKRYYLEQREHS